MAKANLTAERLRELLHYNPETGVFTWHGHKRRCLNGRVAGNQDKLDGYRRIFVDGRMYKAHRLAWFYVHGVWPSGDIDHTNGIKDDNRLCNIRDVSTAENCMNQRRVRRDNASGLMGARKQRNNKWQSAIKANGRYIYLGQFDSPEEAHAAYVEAKRKLHPTFSL